MEIDDENNILAITLSTGTVLIQLLPDVAPLHVERIKTLAAAGEYDNVAFHRVIDGFVAQTGDVQFGDLNDGYDPNLVGFGGSELPDLPAEFSDIPFERGVVGMARASSPDSANSQFFIMFDEASFLNGDFTVFGRVIFGMEFVDQIKRGTGSNGEVTDPDRIVAAEIVDGEGTGLGISPEEAQTVAFLYEAGLDRDGEFDLLGLNFWIDAREAGLSLEDVGEAFLRSAEFEAAFGNIDALSDRELVEQLYLNVLERSGETAGVDFWTNQVGQPDFSRADLLLAFSVSIENSETLEFVSTLTEVDEGIWAFV